MYISILYVVICPYLRTSEVLEEALKQTDRASLREAINEAAAAGVAHPRCNII